MRKPRKYLALYEVIECLPKGEKATGGTIELIW